MKPILIALVVVASIHLSTFYAYACNESICASIVSKCMLMQSCKCDLKNNSCFNNCEQCLSYLYSECCSCVDMCPKPVKFNNTKSRFSEAEMLEGAITMFDSFMEIDDPSQWKVVRFPVDYDKSLYGNKVDQNVKYIMHSNDPDVEDAMSTEDQNKVTLNCSVAYIPQCITQLKCKNVCTDMGASSYRWFYDGCCECVGSTCIDYGINESRCDECHPQEEGNVDPIGDDTPVDDLDYGENTYI